MERGEITPRSYPSNLIDKDWSKRKHFHRPGISAFLDKVHDLEVRADDVYLTTLPKSGTTWMQELVWLLLNDCNFEEALAKDLELRSPFMEFDYLVNEDIERSMKPIEDLKDPRLIKSHLPLALLPSKLWQGTNKVIYVFRNPIDAYVSRYYHGVTFGMNYGKTLQEVFDKLIEKEESLVETMDHAYEFYQIRNEPWVFYTSFERMKKDLRGVINDVSRFLGKPVTEQQMERLLKHLSFEEMKKNPTTNHLWELSQVKHQDKGKETHNFVRKGQVNGYKDELEPQQIEKANILIQRYLDKNSVTLDQLLLLNE
ncbi:hypothetical protein KR018_012514 [Drosophila ironensis]|nr:hypothetical protein KR018_012514 [Drosophila ironensis]